MGGPDCTCSSCSNPEIGRDHYLQAFDVVMGGVSPWRNRELQMSSESAGDSFRKLREFHGRECPVAPDGATRWNYIALAPHIENDKGLLGAQKAQVLALFQHGEVAGLELGDDKLPDGTLKDRPWLKDGMVEHHSGVLFTAAMRTPWRTSAGATRG